MINKKKIILTLLILVFSFYYTNKVSEYIKSKDPIMIKIKKEKENYENKEINAIIENDTIIPGKKGRIVNINKSYQKMKKLKSYSDSLYVYKFTDPKISIKNKYDKLIIKGNSYNKNISLILKIKDIDLLYKIIKYPELNIILDNYFINNYYNDLLNIKNNIIVLENNEILDIIDYCYSVDNFKKLCSINNIYTISPTFIDNDIYYNSYQILENGKIFAYNVINEKDLEKVLLLLSGFKNLGYNIVSIDELIEE